MNEGMGFVPQDVIDSIRAKRTACGLLRHATKDLRRSVDQLKDGTIGKLLEDPESWFSTQTDEG